MKDTRSTSRGPVVGVALAAVVALGAGAFYYTTLDGDGPAGALTPESTSPPSADGSSLVEEPSDPETRRVTFLMDGWSAETVEGATLSYLTNPDPSNIGNDERVQRLNIAPITEADLGALARDTPEILTRAVGRMVTADANVACTPEGCTADGEALPLSYITNPASIPAYGPSYEAYGVDSVLYKADLLVPADTNSIQIQAQGYAPYTFAVNTQEALEGAPEEDTGEVAEPNVQNGFGGERLFVGAAFGRFFVPSPTWSNPVEDGGSALAYDVRFVEEDGPTAESVSSYGDTPLFARGLGAPVSEAAGLSDSKLTSMSSPTVGCEPSVTCVPGVVEVTFERSEPGANFLACPADNSPGQARMVTNVSYWRLTYPAPTHQYGVWDGQSIAGFEGAQEGNPGILQGGLPPLVSGEQSLRVVSGLFFTGVEAPRLWDVNGYVAQEGKDPEETFTVTYNESNISDLNNGYFTTC